MECCTQAQLICTSAFTPQHKNRTCHLHYKQFLFSLNDGFLHVLQMQLNAKLHYACSGSYTIQTRVINYEDEWLPPACQHGLLLRLGMRHSGHEGQLYHGSPAGSGSSGPLDWPQSSWTDRSPGCHPLPSPWSSGSCEDPDRFSDGSSNQTACMAGQHQGHEWQILQSHCSLLTPAWSCSECSGG